MLRLLAWTVGLFVVAALGGCGGLITTSPIHGPIFPAGGAAVTYTVDATAEGGIAAVRLFETASTVDAAGTVTAGTETLLNTWTPAGSPVSQAFSFTKAAGNPNNRLVTYRFEVECPNGTTRSHNVTYATSPYPVADQPAPIYVQGDPANLIDFIFIPDDRLTSAAQMAAFQTNCSGMITASILNEDSIRFWSRQFNFYINPQAGHATDFDSISTDGLHTTPGNWANLTFAEVKGIMHNQAQQRDYAIGDLFSTIMTQRGIMRHESGHAAFGLADEYCCDSSYFQPNPLPNIWNSQAGAEADASSRHKTAADVTKLGATLNWWKICNANCQMNVAGLATYDLPCDDRVVYMIIDTAINP